MKFKEYLTEEYFGMLLRYKTDMPIFKNPSKQELREIENKSKKIDKQKYLRMLIDKKKGDVYAFSYLLSHEDVAHKIRYPSIEAKKSSTGILPPGFGKVREPYTNFYYAIVGLFKGNEFQWNAFWGMSDKETEDCNKKLEERGWKARYTKVLDEEFLTNIKADHYSYPKSIGLIAPVFVNPSKKELRECGRNIRFIIDFKNKKIYCWDGDQIVHYEVAKYLQKQNILPEHEDILSTKDFWQNFYAGVGGFVSGKIFHNRAGDYFVIDDVKDAPWTYKKNEWLDYWFSVPFMKSFHDKYDLDEEYITSFKAAMDTFTFSGGQTEVFKNPSSKEIRSFIKKDEGNTVRFFVDLDNNCLYAWKASTIHWPVFRQLQKEGIDLRNYYQGVAEFRNGKLHEINADSEYWDAPILILNGQEQDRPLNYKESKIVDRWIVQL